MFERAPQDLLGRGIAELVGTEQAAAIARATAGFGDLRERNPLEMMIAVGAREVAFDVILHRESAGQLLVELELATGPRPFSFPNTYLAVRGSVAELNRASTLTELYEITARAVRELTGFDRVMVYRYDAEYNGEVVAEAKRDDLNSFLGLHYPASDIPAQARALYEKNWIRIIDDIGYTPSPLVPQENPATGRPIDLTHSTLRSVSPIHVEYLKNMGVGASMSISLMRDGRLWGLIACHHYSGPHLPPYGVRAAAEFLGSTLSLRLVDRVEDDELRTRLAGQAILAKIAAAMQNQSEPLGSALLGAPDVADLVPADGIVMNVDGERVTRGAVPDAGVIDELVAWLSSQEVGVFETDCVSESIGTDVAPELVSGLLALMLPDNHYLIWLRGELRRAVDWGGDPTNKAIAVREGDSVRLSPRKSFDRWREIVQRRSAPWLDTERANAAALRQSIVETLYARSEREVRLAETLQRSLLPDVPTVSRVGAVRALRTGGRRTDRRRLVRRVRAAGRPGRRRARRCRRTRHQRGRNDGAAAQRASCLPDRRRLHRRRGGAAQRLHDDVAADSIRDVGGRLRRSGQRRRRHGARRAPGAAAARVGRGGDDGVVDAVAADRRPRGELRVGPAHPGRGRGPRPLLRRPDRAPRRRPVRERAPAHRRRRRAGGRR